MRQLRSLLAERVVVPGAEPSRARRLTALLPDPRRAGALRLEIDGAPFGALAREDARGLAVGLELDEALLRRLTTAADAEAALRAALRMLARRAFARADLGRRLRKRGHAVPAASAALDRLAGMGLLDDAAFARQFVASRAARGHGPSRIARELGQLGVARELADAALAERDAAGEDDGATPRRLIAGRLRQLGDLPVATLRRRLLLYLSRRGHTGPAIQRLVREAIAARASDADAA